MREINQKSNNNQECSKEKILSRENVKIFFLVFCGILGIILLFYALSFVFRFRLGSNSVIWPIWGFFTFPNLMGIITCGIILFCFLLAIKYIYKEDSNPKLYIITILGLILIVGTNLIHGWQMGIAGAITQDITRGAEIYNDAIKIKNVFEFISNYETIQPSLGVHSRTHPPGAVIFIYFLYLLFKDPGLIAIALCSISTILSSYFLNGIFKRYFDEKLSKFMTLLFLLLPAVQIYYLANIYAIVISLILGVIFFYFHPNKKKGIIGASICLFLATFISFMSFFIVLCLFIFEMIKFRTAFKAGENNLGTNKFIQLYKNLNKLIIIIGSVVSIYSLFLVLFGFNYLNAFLYASESENSQGFALIANPIKYIVTRVANILDILIFFGPILIVLCYRGFKILKEESKINKDISSIYKLFVSAIIALITIFLIGAYDHGETARAAIYIYPFLLLPVAIYLKKEKFPQIELKKLIILIFLQTLLMQLFGFYIW